MYSIKEVTTFDYNAVARFLSTFENEDRTTSDWIERLHFFFDNNPAFHEDMKRGFVLLYDNNIVGFTCAFPSEMCIGEKIITTMNGSTWRVNREHRSMSAELWLTNREYTNKYLYFNSTPTDRVAAMLRKLKFIEVNLSSNWKKDIYIIGKKAQVFIKKGLLSFIYYYYQAIKILAVTSKMTFLKKIDEKDINTLWYKKDKQFENYKNYRYFKWLSENPKILVLSCYNKGIFAGILVISKSSGKAEIIDFLIEDETIWRDIIVCSIGIVQEYGFSLLRIPCYNRTIRKAGKFFLKRKSIASLFMKKNRKQEEYSYENLVKRQGDYGL